MIDLLSTILIGMGATIVMDIWALVRRKLLGIPLANYGLVWRWIAYMPCGQFYQEKIKETPAVCAEQTMGWIIHYLIGIAFAFLLVGLYGTEWIANPTVMPALIVGVATIVAPFFFMMPGMGMGVAASRTPKPNLSRLHSLITHSVFGLGMYLTAALMIMVL